MIAAVYARKSSDDERSSEDGRSVDRQVHLAREFAARRGWAVADEYVFSDANVSGAEFRNRPGLSRLLAALPPRPPFGALIIMEQSRLGRDTIRTLALIQTLQDAGVEIYSYGDGRQIDVASEMGEVQQFMGAWAASQERRHTSRRTREALVRKAKLGHSTGARVYGYTLVRKGEHSEYVIDQAQADVVRKVFERAADGYGDKRIVATVNADHVPSPSGKGWTRELIRGLLKNSMYRGVSVFGRTRSVARGGSAGKREPAPKDAWITTPVPHLQIVPDDLWSRVQARKAKTRAHFLRTPDGRLLGKPESGLVARYLLNGILRCHVCGGAMGVNVKNATTRRYYCLGRGRATCGNGAGVPMAALDRAVAERVEALMTSEAWQALEDRAAAWDQENKRQILGDEESRAATEREVERLEAEIARLVNALASGASHDVTTAINERRAQLEALKTKLAAPVIAIDWDVFKADFPAYMDALRRNGSIVDGDPGEVRQILRKLGVERIVATPDERGWNFEGLADLGRLVNAVGRKGAPPLLPDTPHRFRTASIPSQVSHLTLTTRPPVIFTRSAGARRKSAFGVPAAAQIVSWPRRSSSMNVSSGRA